MKKEYSYPSISQIENLAVRLIELNRELAEKNMQLEKSELARKNMFSNVTHDLRAPVAAIRGATERLCSGGIDDDERNKMIRIIDTRVEALDHLIGDLYYSTLVEQPDFLPKLSHHKIAPVLEEYAISLNGSGRLRDREGRLSIPAGFDACVMLDPQYFSRVMENLTSNALRHTKKNDVIELGCRANENLVEIYVRDTGSGISERDLPFIFDHTFAGEYSRTPGKSGSGLGLSIARAIIEKHGGTIDCHSVYGEGATFIISLPEAP